MRPSLPSFSPIPIQQHPARVDEESLANCDAVIWLLDGDFREASDRLPLGHLPAQRSERAPEGSDWLPVGLPGGGQGVAARIRPGMETFEALQLAGRIMQPIVAARPERIAVISALQGRADAERMAEALTAALHAGLFRMPRIGRNDPAPPNPERLEFHGDFGAPDFSRAEVTAEGNNLARWLTHLPGNYLTPGIYQGFATALAEREGWQTEFWNRRELEKLGAGAFLSVIASSPRDDGGILRLRYRPAGAQGAPLALVGKGICFDTGGTNLKNASGMLGMHGDMGGSAAALGTLLALSRSGFSEPVDCWLALAENHIGPQAVRCNDVVTALDGTTIEIINTDAEGRMVLADTLALAVREPPRAILDFATLTGSCVAALGHRMSGAMSNRDGWIPELLAAGRACGERVWPLPAPPDYDADLESPVADIRQCRPPTEADHIYAARFLNRFVADQCGWVHVDLSASTREGGLGHVPTDTTGFGVRFGTEWLQRLADGRVNP